MPEITVNLNLSQQAALRLAKDLAYDNDVRRAVAEDPVATLKGYGITVPENLGFTRALPPKHVFQQALVNVAEASEFASDEGFESPDPFAFWLFVVFLAT